MISLVRKFPNLPYAAFFVLLGAALSLVIVLTRSEPVQGHVPFTYMDQDDLRGALAGCAALGIALFLVFRRFASALFFRRLRPVFIAGALTLTAAAGVHYFYFTRAYADNHYLNFHDLYHYFLGCKYYPEVGYFEQYNCHMKASAEAGERTFKDETPVRDLFTYRMVTSKDAKAKADCDRFDEARWQEFQQDTAFFARHMSAGALTDHGYNGTPFFAAVGGVLVDLPRVTYRNLVLLTLVDLWALSILFAVVVIAFGPKIGLIFALFHFVNFGDYYYHVSFLRYLWMATLGIGIVFLYRKHYGKAAVFLVVSAMLNVFPILFIAGVAWKILYTLIFKRSLPSPYRRFIAWALVASVACGGISLLHERPIERYRAFFSKQARHSGLITPTRTGFLYNFMYRNALKAPPDISLPDIGLYKVYRQNQIPRIVLTVVLIGLFMWLITRLDDYQSAALGGFVLLFMLFSTVVYYYACASLLLLLWKGNDARGDILWPAALLFALMTAVFAFWHAVSIRAFANNTVFTAALTVFLAVTFIALSLRFGLFEKKSFGDGPR